MANAINIPKTHLIMGLSLPRLLGRSVALNGAGTSPVRAKQPTAGMELNTEYVKA